MTLFFGFTLRSKPSDTRDKILNDDRIYDFINHYIAKIPALSCRLGHVPYDHAFGALTSSCTPHDRAHSALLINYPLQKSLTKEKIWLPRDSNLNPQIS